MTSLSTEPSLRVAPRRLQQFTTPWLLALLLTCGLAFRAAPLLNQDGRLLRQFPTEDGYLMLTIARNIALDKGMSIADGTIPTNGTQPAVTFLWALCYRLVGGDKVLGVALVQVVQILVSLAAAYMLYRLGRLLLAGRPGGRSVAALTAGLWYAAPLGVQHSMNCLETGVYAAVVLATLIACLTAWRSSRDWTVRQCVALGVLLGLCFWVRNDAVLLIAAVCIVRAASSLADRRLRARRLAESAVVGLTTLCAALPWMIHNKVRFGHIMPISGVSEAMDGTFAGNLPHLPAKFAEYILVVGAIPTPLEQNPIVLPGCILAIACLVLATLRLGKQVDPAGRAALAVCGLFALLLTGFYGMFFGAGHFMSRYLFPLSGPLALVTLCTLSDLRQRARPGRLASVGTVAGGLVAAGVLLAVNVRTYVQGRTHMHFQAVEWVLGNIPPAAWIAAPQTGTIGYFHDRTINLDGKVNPQALRARMAPGTPNGIPQYIVEKNIEYIVDWAGVAEWVRLPALRPHFRLLLNEPQRGPMGLAVLARTEGKAAASAHGH